MNRKLKIYWAGALFNHKDLAGNILLARRLEEVSHGRFIVELPQDSEPGYFDAAAIRDANFRSLISCDLFLANFDGSDLDSGTVVEFSCAKMFDIPAVLLRTDFRFCADRGSCSDPWNLMCSHFPRTKNVLVDSMRDLYFRMKGTTQLEAFRRFHADVAEKIIAAFDRALKTPSVCGTSEAEILSHYECAFRLLGGNVRKLFTDDELRGLIARKVRNGLYSAGETAARF